MNDTGLKLMHELISKSISESKDGVQELSMTISYREAFGSYNVRDRGCIDVFREKAVHRVKDVMYGDILRELVDITMESDAGKAEHVGYRIRELIHRIDSVGKISPAEQAKDYVNNILEGDPQIKK